MARKVAFQVPRVTTIGPVMDTFGRNGPEFAKTVENANENNALVPGCSQITFTKNTGFQYISNPHGDDTSTFFNNLIGIR